MALEDRYVTPTPEGVSLNVVLAGLGSRFAAYLLDVVIQAAAFAIVALAAGAVVDGTRGDSTSVLVVDGFIAVFALVDYFGYFIACDLWFSGRSIGKRVAGIRVVRVGGGPVGFWSSLLRNILRLVDYMPALYLIGAILILATPRNQRLGDLAGGTIVIRERTAAMHQVQAVGWHAPQQWAAVPGAAGSVPWGWAPATAWGAAWLPPELAHWDVSGIGHNDLLLAQMFLSNRLGYAPEARARLAVELAGRLWPLVAGVPPGIAPEQFLEGVVLVKSVRG